jgi:hypothetical protein
MVFPCRVIPAVGAQKNDFHIFPPLWNADPACMQKGGMIILSHHEKVNAVAAVCCLNRGLIYTGKWL